MTHVSCLIFYVLIYINVYYSELANSKERPLNKKAFSWTSINHALHEWGTIMETRKVLSKNTISVSTSIQANSFCSPKCDSELNLGWEKLICCSQGGRLSPSDQADFSSLYHRHLSVYLTDSSFILMVEHSS